MSPWIQLLTPALNMTLVRYAYVCLHISCISLTLSVRYLYFRSNQLHAIGRLELSGQPKGRWTPELRPQTQYSGTHK